jgi:hypothetical protein
VAHSILALPSVLGKILGTWERERDRGRGGESERVKECVRE